MKLSKEYLYVSPTILKELTESKEMIDKFKEWMYCVKICFMYERVPYMDYTKRISRAFYKMFEMRNIVDKKHKNVYCLCEAPGGFYEAIRLINPDANITVQSIDNTTIKFSKTIPKEIITYSDITKFSSIMKIISHSKKINGYNLMTADGGIDVSHNYNMQEKINTKLIFCQIFTMLYSLKKGGNFVIKVFDTFTLPMIQILWILEQHFQSSTMVKPNLSRPCNSEKYIVCKNFTGKPIYKHLHKFIVGEFNGDFDISIPESTVQKYIRQNNNFATVQIYFLKDTIASTKMCKDYNWINYKKNRQHKMSKKCFDSLKIRNHSNSD